MKQTKVNQCAIVLDVLMKRGRISTASARKRGIMNLGARVSELRFLGLNIRTTSEGYVLGNRKVRKVRVIHEDDLFPDYE